MSLNITQILPDNEIDPLKAAENRVAEAEKTWLYWQKYVQKNNCGYLPAAQATKEWHTARADLAALRLKLERKPDEE